MKRVLLCTTAIVACGVLGGCSWFGSSEAPLAFQRIYVRTEIPAALTAPVPHPPVPPAPVTESAAIARDQAYGEALDLCNLQKGEIERLAAGGLPTADQRAK